MGVPFTEPSDGRQNRWLAVSLAALGALAVVCALVMTPEFAVRHQAIRNELTPERLGRLEGLRLMAAAGGAALIVLGLRARWLSDWLPRASARCGLPVAQLAAVLGVFGVFFVANLALQIGGLVRHTARLFPISVVRMPEVHWSGLPWLAGFVGLSWWAASRHQRLGMGRAWAVGTLLLVLGNLGQGGFEAGFALPLTDPRGGPPPGIQYYHEALGVDDAHAWLAGFNAAQPRLGNHARTHPPFAVLVHRALLETGGARVGLLAGVLVALASLSLPLTGALARTMGVDSQRCVALMLLLAVVPAFNVYAAVSLDGVILTTSTLALCGLQLVRRGSPLLGTAVFALGFLASHALTFGATWLAAAAVLLGAVDAWRERRFACWAALGAALACLGLCGWLLYDATGYDHWTAFLTASRLENPHGFRGLAEPLLYLATRIEGVAEIALFLSVPAVAVLLSPPHRGPLAFDLRSDPERTILCGVGALAAMLLAGAWCTGETARACLFVMPLLVLAFSTVPRPTFAPLLVAIAVQTAAMQGFANFFW